MKQSEIKVGGLYWTNIGGARARVRVLQWREGYTSPSGRKVRGTFIVEREETPGKPLPKGRTANALHDTSGPW